MYINFAKSSLTFDYSTYSQKEGEYFAKFRGLLRIYELYVSGYLVYIIHTILHSKYGIHASSSFPHWISDCWYKPFVRLLCDTSVQFGFAIIAHLLYHCAKDRRGVLALHSLSYTWRHNAAKLVLYSIGRRTTNKGLTEKLLVQGV